MEEDLFLVGLITIVCLVFGAVFFLKFATPPTVLPKKDFEKFPLIKKTELSHDTREFVFGLPDGHILGLPTGQHISLRFKDDDGKMVQRSYTPISDNSTVGKVILVVKVYKAGVHPKFPDGGKMSQHLDSLKIGDAIEMKGPKGHMEYLPSGKFTVKPLGKPLEHRETKQIIMIAGGTGITPMLQVLNYIFTRPGVPGIKVKMLYANQTEDDILVRKELEAMAKEFPDRFSLHYTLDRPPSGWKHSSGFIDKAMLEKYCLFNNSYKDTQVFICGPPPMIKFACEPNLTALGFTKKELVIF